MIDKSINTVDIWLLEKSKLLQFSYQWQNILSAEEKKRANHFYFEEDRISFILYHACKRLILSQYLSASPEKLLFSAQEQGKPFLKNEKLFFNLSHTKDIAILAVSFDTDVGIDIEMDKNSRNYLDIAKRFFHSDEYNFLSTIQDKQKQQKEFFVVWTAKEAILKATGEGIVAGLDSFCVQRDLFCPITLIHTHPQKISLTTLIVPMGYTASLAAFGKAPSVQNREFSSLTHFIR